MTREIVLDTETTGLSPRQGHRVIEVACVEIVDLIPTGATPFYVRIDPERDIDPDAERVHGISRASLAGQPRFAEEAVVDRFLDFIGDAPIIAHNAGFDRDFINHELALAGRAPLDEARWVDSLALARRRFPGMGSYSLDAICRRLKISLAEREKHGALIDAQLLARVYLELRGGRERSLDLTGPGAATPGAASAYGARLRPISSLVTEAERLAHEAFVASEVRDAIWLKA